jgi:endogenous inhibitor of DNA gyrase (YacG/DUF329 family)
MSTPTRYACPTCKREIQWNNDFPWRPFCSERCKMVDLGAWLANDRAIPDDGTAELPAEANPEGDPPV